MISETVKAMLDTALCGHIQDTTLRRRIDDAVEWAGREIIDERNGYYAAKIQRLEDENAILRNADEDLSRQLTAMRADYAKVMRK